MAGWEEGALYSALLYCIVGWAGLGWNGKEGEGRGAGVGRSGREAGEEEAEGGGERCRMEGGAVEGEDGPCMPNLPTK